MSKDEAWGETHARPRRPRPAVWPSASTTRPSFAREREAAPARSFVLATRSHTAMRRPISRVASPHSIWSGQSLGAGPR